jgi:hypothetical protein
MFFTNLIQYNIRDCKVNFIRRIWLDGSFYRFKFSKEIHVSLDFYLGGTADITVHEKLEGTKLRELCKASGDACGGTSVDNAFFQTFVKILGGPVLSPSRDSLLERVDAASVFGKSSSKCSLQI